MFKNKILLSALFVGLMISPVFAEELSDIQYPKPPAYRVGISSVPENQYIEATAQKYDNSSYKYARLGDNEKIETTDTSYADLSIKRLSKEIAQELEYEENDMVADLSLLWQGAATQSDTINFALYKLSNPDADKPDKNSLKKVLTTIASMSTLVGAGIGNPIIAGSSLISGNILGIMSQDTKALNYKYTKVTDADMIILIRKVEDLQQTAVNLYYDYMCAKKQLEMTTKLVEERSKKFELAQKNHAQRELVVINDAYYRTALDKQRTAKSEFFAKRAALEQFVGNATFLQFEEELAARENGIKTAYNPTTDVKTDVPNQMYPTAQSRKYDTPVQDIITEVDKYTENSEELAPLPMLGEDDETKLALASTDTENSSSTKDKKSKKNKTEKTPKVKRDKYTTKGFIFLHNNEHHQSDVPGQARRERKEAKKNAKNGEVNVTQTKTNTSATKTNNNFLPLDEIKTPELRINGYSIHDSQDL